MPNGHRTTARGVVSQGSLVGGQPTRPGGNGSTFQPRIAQTRGANPHINQHSAHLQRTVQAKMAQPKAMRPMPQPRSTTGSTTVQRKIEPRKPGAAFPARTGPPVVVKTRIHSTVQRMEDPKPKVAASKFADPVAEAAIDKDIAGVERDVIATMKHIKAQIAAENEWAQKARASLKVSGRDWFVYAPFASWFYYLDKILEGWNESSSMEDTTSLLIDVALALRAMVSKPDAGPESVMSAEMSASRQKNKRVNMESAWARGLPAGARLQSGASATTGLVLQMLRHFKVSQLQIEAVMNGLYHYWNAKRGPWGPKLKHAMGDFHTAAEIWSVYNYFLLNQGAGAESKPLPASAALPPPQAGPQGGPQPGQQAGPPGDSGPRRAKL